MARATASRTDRSASAVLAGLIGQDRHLERRAVMQSLVARRRGLRSRAPLLIGPAADPQLGSLAGDDVELVAIPPTDRPPEVRLGEPRDRVVAVRVGFGVVGIAGEHEDLAGHVLGDEVRTGPWQRRVVDPRLHDRGAERHRAEVRQRQPLGERRRREPSGGSRGGCHRRRSPRCGRPPRHGRRRRPRRRRAGTVGRRRTRRCIRTERSIDWR